MVEKIGGPFGTALGELDCSGQQHRLLSGIVGSGLDAEHRIEIVDAVDRRGRITGTAWVEPDDVEPIEQRVAVDGPGLLGEHVAAVARTAGVHEQRPDASIGVGCGSAHQRDRDGGATGILVVEWHAEPAGLEADSGGTPLDRIDLER